jgi:hypothetical protein
MERAATTSTAAVSSPYRAARFPAVAPALALGTGGGALCDAPVASPRARGISAAALSNGSPTPESS